MLSSLLFANDQFDIIENQFIVEKIVNLENYSIDYDIDIFNNQMNIEIEGLKQPNLNFKNMKKNISIGVCKCCMYVLKLKLLCFFINT